MSEKLSVELKQKLYSYCVKFVDDKISNASNAIDAAQKSANQETKSSAGDKYETTRAMLHLDQEKYATQLVEANKLKRVLNQVEVNREYKEVQLGCIVSTNHGNFFIAISAGEIIEEGESYKAISLAAPIGQALNKSKINDKVTFRDKKYIIQSII